MKIIRDVLLLILCGSAFAALAGPQIVCEPPGIDLGLVTGTSAVDRVVHVWNRGDQPLVIKRVIACCGATASLDSKIIPPGTNTAMRICVDLAGRTGELRKTIRMVSNDAGHPVCAVVVTGRPAAPGGHAIQGRTGGASEVSDLKVK